VSASISANRPCVWSPVARKVSSPASVPERVLERPSSPAERSKQIGYRRRKGCCHGWFLSIKSTLRSQGIIRHFRFGHPWSPLLRSGTQFISSVIGVAVSSSREWICGGGPPPGGTDASIAKYGPADSSPSRETCSGRRDPSGEPGIDRSVQ